MSLVEDLRSWWLGQAGVPEAVGERIHYLHVPQNYLGTYLWYARAGSGDDEFRCLDDGPGQAYDFVELVDVEAISTDGKAADDLALLLKALDSWTKWHGPIGSGTAQAVFVRDHLDDYVPAGAGGDLGRVTAALRFEIRGYEPGG